MSSESVESLRARLGDAVRAHQRAVDALDEAVAARLGVNRTDLRCLDVLIQEGPLVQEGGATPGELASRLGLTTGSVTAMLDRLSRLGYLTREPDPSDRRRVRVRATPRAEALAMQLYGPLAEEGAAELAPYDAAELALLVDFHERARRLQERHLERIRGTDKP